MSIYLGTTPIADGASTALLAGKANTDLSNCTKPYITQTYVNGTSWYRVWSDGWCEQGGDTGIGSSTGSKIFNFLKTFANTNYTILTSDYGSSGVAVPVSANNIIKNTSSFSTETWTDMGKRWIASGYIS